MSNEIKDQELGKVSGGAKSYTPAEHRLKKSSDVKYQITGGDLVKAKIVRLGSAYKGTDTLGRACYEIEINSQNINDPKINVKDINGWYFEPSGNIFTEQDKHDPSLYFCIDIHY